MLNIIINIIFLDPCKPFDAIDHEIVITKLYLYGIRESALKWFKSYLAQRTPICKIYNVTSPPKFIECGVPQGSNLGALTILQIVSINLSRICIPTIQILLQGKRLLKS